MAISLPSGPLRFNLLVYTHDRVNAYQALALRDEEDEMILLYSFYNGRTFTHPKVNCMPIDVRRDLPIMCKEKFWEGLIVFWKGTDGKVIQDGRMNSDAGWPGCELLFRDRTEAEQNKPWMPLQHCRIIGHTDAVL